MVDNCWTEKTSLEILESYSVDLDGHDSIDKYYLLWGRCREAEGEKNSRDYRGLAFHSVRPS